MAIWDVKGSFFVEGLDSAGSDLDAAKCVHMRNNSVRFIENSMRSCITRRGRGRLLWTEPENTTRIPVVWLKLMWAAFTVQAASIGVLARDED